MNTEDAYAIRQCPPIDTSGASPALFAALAKAQSEVSTVGKDGENKHGNYNYATAESMIREARKRLAANGLAFVASCHVCQPSKAPSGDIGKRFIYAEVVTEWRLVHVEGACIAGWTEMPALANTLTPPDKAIMAASTYSRGYILRDLLMIDRAEEEAYSPDQRREEEERERREQSTPQQSMEIGLLRQTLVKAIGCKSDDDVTLILNWIGAPADVTVASIKANPGHASLVVSELTKRHMADGLAYNQMLATARNAVEPPSTETTTEEPPAEAEQPEPENAETDYCAVVVDLLRREIGCKRAEQVDHVFTWLCLPEDITAVTVRTNQDHARQVHEVLTSDTQSPYSEILAEAERAHQASEAVEEAFT